MKSRSEIWLSALKEAGAQCSVETQLDAKLMTSRVREEGESFFTTTLPKYGKDLEEALSVQRITPELFVGFKRRKLCVEVFSDQDNIPLFTYKQSGGVPQFLSGFLDLLFANTLEMKESELAFAVDRAPVLLQPSMLQRTNAHGWTLEMADAVQAIRQLTLMFGKEKDRCDPRFLEPAYRDFIETDRSLDDPLWTSDLPTSSEVDGSQISSGSPD